ncbi:MAG TPA: efflux RND transporter periplasmic adaptor subunit, partial [Myxococcota bacterium]|nr:efflux RND transporter periplasmic adaptor subunit [Myxococcota bacterium]
SEDVLFEVVDTSVMWAEIEVAEGDVAAMREGLAVTFAVDSLAGRTFTSRVSYIAPEVDPHSRTVLVRAALDNNDGLLRANMFARAELQTPGEREAAPDTKPAVLVPRSAIQGAKAVSMVFVPVEPDVFEGRRVEVGRTLGDGRVEVRGRLAVGERVVDAGAFLLKTETLKDSIGAGCCADEGGK